MDKKKTKNQEISSLLRQPKAKKTLGLKVPVIQLPHLELVQQFPQEIKDLKDTTPSHSSQPSHSVSSSEIKKRKTDISPIRDFQKVPNSYTNKAIPEGLFKPGKSKHLYDVLYSLTRGAIEPKRSLRISKTKLMKKAGIGSRITFDSIISHFESNGLITVKVYTGEHEGNEFEVFTYEELTTLPSQSSQRSQRSSAQKLDRVVSLETSQSSQSINVEKQDTYSEAKTFFKTLNLSIDDELPICKALEKLNTAAKTATGKNLTRKDWEGLIDIIEIVVSETSIARTRTKTISTYLKFAAENLRRRLYSRKAEPRTKSSSNEKQWIEVGKNEQSDEYDEQGNYIPKPLGEKGLSEALKVLSEYQSWDAPLEESKRFYTAEDWEWLMENLRISQNKVKEIGEKE